MNPEISIIDANCAKLGNCNNYAILALGNGNDEHVLAYVRHNAFDYDNPEYDTLDEETYDALEAEHEENQYRDIYERMFIRFAVAFAEYGLGYQEWIHIADRLAKGEVFGKARYDDRVFQYITRVFEQAPDALARIVRVCFGKDHGMDLEKARIGFYFASEESAQELTYALNRNSTLDCPPDYLWENTDKTARQQAVYVL